MMCDGMPQLCRTARDIEKLAPASMAQARILIVVKREYVQ
jgi:hypothetical protein